MSTVSTCGRPTMSNLSTGIRTPCSAYRSMPACPATKIRSKIPVTGL